MKEIVKALNLDANESIFFARELEHIKATAYDIRYPQFKATVLIPVSGEAGSGANSITYEQYDMVGMAKIIADYADDLPRADVKGKEFTTPVRGIGNSFGYSLQDVRASAKAGKNLPNRKALAARKANDQEVNDIAWYGNPALPKYAGLTGMIYNPNITVSTVPTRSGRTSWITDAKTPDEILADLNEIVGDIVDLTKGVEEPNTVLLPYLEYTHIASTPRSANSDTTILKYFLENNPYIDRVEPLNELKAVDPKPSGSGAANLLICYRRDPMNLTLEIPQPYEQLPVQERGLEYVVPCHSRCGGVIIYYPLSVAIYEGI